MSEPTKTKIVFTGTVPPPNPQQTEPGVKLRHSGKVARIDNDGDLQIQEQEDHKGNGFEGALIAYLNREDLPALLDLMLELQPWIETLR